PCRGRAPDRDDPGLRAGPRRRPHHALRPVPARGPARLPRRARMRHAPAPAWGRAVLDASVLPLRRPAPAAGRRHRPRHPGRHRVRLTRVFVDAPLAPGTRVALPEAAAAHLVRVLRLREGDACVLFNGDGHDYGARLAETGKRGAVAEVLEARRLDNESSLRVMLVQGIARGEKMDLVLQKATELGVARIVPVDAERTEVRLDGERLRKRMEHWRGVVASACEQSGRARVPAVDAPVAIDRIAGHVGDATVRLCLDPEDDCTLSGLGIAAD